MPAVLHPSHIGRNRLCRAVLAGIGVALLASGARASAEELVWFEIPAQPIATAIDAYSSATGLEVFYDGALAAGRRSNMIRGTFAPDSALRELLAGTGLAARPTGRGSFTLLQAPSRPVSSVADQSYFAAIQTKVSEVLCAHRETQPGEADLLVRLWIASSGTIARAQLSDASDASTKEGAFAAVLRGLPVGVPPAGMPQPVTMAIMARHPGQPTGCANANADTLAGSR
jgi:hypothetical protein